MAFLYSLWVFHVLQCYFFSCLNEYFIEVWVGTKKDYVTWIFNQSQSIEVLLLFFAGKTEKWIRVICTGKGMILIIKAFLTKSFKSKIGLWINNWCGFGRNTTYVFKEWEKKYFTWKMFKFIWFSITKQILKHKYTFSMI